MRVFAKLFTAARSLSGETLDDRVREISQATESDPAASVLKRIREKAAKG